jgi:hypothetical protein
MVARRLLELGDRVARRKFIMDLPPQLSSVVDRIGRLATGGGFWMGVAAALAVTGPRARRARASRPRRLRGEQRDHQRTGEVGEPTRPAVRGAAGGLSPPRSAPSHFVATLIAHRQRG